MKPTANHPQWALAHKKPGTELRCIRGKYYLYECTCYYDKELKKSRKKTGTYLGRITEDGGFIPPRRKLMEIEVLQAEEVASSGKIIAPEVRVGRTKEYGLSAFIINDCQKLIENLKLTFSTQWNRILALAYCRLSFQSPLQDVYDDFIGSYLSQSIGALGLSARVLSDFLSNIGNSRDAILAFMRLYVTGEETILFDGTDLLSSSTKMDFPRMSKTKLGGFAEAINLMMAFSTTNTMPVYYKLLQGNIKDVVAFIICVDEVGNNNITAVGDKGFFSKANIEKLEERKVSFIIAMRRSTAGLDYTVFENDKYEGVFIYANRAILYSTQNILDHTVYLYKDVRHAAEEDNDYLLRVHNPDKPEYTMDGYKKAKAHFGTLALMVSDNRGPQKAYEDYKSRCEVEQEIDVLKSDLDALTSYMQDNERLEGWMFINFIALHIYYTLKRKILEKGLSKEMSTREAIKILRRQRVIKYDKKWVIDVASKKDITRLEALGIPMNDIPEQKVPEAAQSEVPEAAQPTQNPAQASICSLPKA